MMSHELAERMLAMPDGHVTVQLPAEVRDDEIAPIVVYSLQESVYSGEPAVELELS